MRVCSVMLLFAALMLGGCMHEPAEKAERKPTTSQGSLGQVDVALVGTWATAVPDEPTQVAQVELKHDEQWSFWPPPSQRPEYVDAKKPSQTGTWFVRKGTLFLRVEQSESDKIIPGMAFAFDIKSVSSDRAVVLWGGQEMRFRKVR